MAQHQELASANLHNQDKMTCGQSYKHFTIVNYDSRVITWGNFKSVKYDRRGFIRLATGP